jgi:hypothetical protein
MGDVGLGVALDEGCGERLLGRKMVEEGALRALRGGDDLIDARGGETLLDDEVFGLVEESLPRGLSVSGHKSIVSDRLVCYNRLISLKRRIVRPSTEAPP